MVLRQATFVTLAPATLLPADTPLHIQWQDTDGDGRGDNADTDDDGDGYTDDEAAGANTDPRDPLRFPVDR
jgi:hypothetical protein